MSTITKAKLDRRYLELLRLFPLRPIRNKRELEQAMRIAGHLATYNEDSLPRGGETISMPSRSSSKTISGGIVPR